MMNFHKVTLEKGGKTILNQISFHLSAHKITAVLGKNGSGKSSLLSCAVNLTPYRGTISYLDRNLALMSEKERARLIAFLPQHVPDSSFSVKELVSLGRIPYLSIGRRLGKEDLLAVEEALEKVGLEDRKEQSVGELSGGERQKAYLAMVLAQNTRIVLLDEPTTYLDMENEKKLLELIVELKEKHKKTVLVVLHDLTQAVEIAEDLVVLCEGKCVYAGSVAGALEQDILEKTFQVKRGSYEKNGKQEVLFYS